MYQSLRTRVVKIELNGITRVQKCYDVYLGQLIISISPSNLYHLPFSKYKIVVVECPRTIQQKQYLFSILALYCSTAKTY